jgi:hypothetical protein
MTAHGPKMTPRIAWVDGANYHPVAVVGVDGSLDTSLVVEGPDEETFDPVDEGTRSYWPDVLGVAWVLATAFLALVPALVHGPYIGSFDFQSIYGLTTVHGAVVHNAANGDISDEVVPWIQTAWIQVHHGHVPLWIRNEALGMPLAFNFGSGVFSLPALISYLTPLRLVLWIQILVSIVVGGTGAYFFGRILRLHPFACAIAGTTWVLSGPFWGYLGLPDTSVMSWAGWQFGAVVLIVRGKHRLASVALFAVAFAFSIYAGNPQIELVILIPLVVFFAVLLLYRRLVPDESGPIRRPAADLVLAGLAGTALSAPLALPGLQLANASIRSLSPTASASPPSQVIGTVFQSFWGQPLPGSFPSAQGFYQETWVYVGAIAVALSVVAVVIRWRRPEVMGLAAGALIALVASIWQPFDDLLSHLPVVGHSWWSRSLIPLAFCLAMLAGIGLDTVIRGRERRRAARCGLRTFGAIAILLALIWLVGRGDLAAPEADVRAKSFVWPAVATAIGLVVFAVLVLAYRRWRDDRWGDRRWRLLTIGVAVSLLASQSVLLIVADEVIPSSSSTEYPPHPAVTTLQRAIGSTLVGLGYSKGRFTTTGLGLAPDTNVPYGVDEFAEYDPITPSSWFETWYKYNHSSSGVPDVYYFAPSIRNATVARRYGISYVLVARGAPGPSGSVFDTRVGDEDLYRIPGAAMATLVPIPPSGRWPSIDAPGKAVPVAWPGPAEIRVVTNASSPRVLRLRVSSVPGWHATIDGRPLALTPYLSNMFQARIPPGQHVVELHYWPNRFNEGLVIGGCTVLALVAAAFVARWRRPTPPGDPDPEDADASPPDVTTPTPTGT